MWPEVTCKIKLYPSSSCIYQQHRTSELFYSIVICNPLLLFPFKCSLLFCRFLCVIYFQCTTTSYLSTLNPFITLAINLATLAARYAWNQWSFLILALKILASRIKAICIFPFLSASFCQKRFMRLRHWRWRWKATRGISILRVFLTVKFMHPDYIGYRATQLEQSWRS